MQAIEHGGTEREIEPFNKRKLFERLEDPKVKEVKVFKLQPGHRLTVQGMTYKVIAVRPNGKITMKPVAGV